MVKRDLKKFAMQSVHTKLVLVLLCRTDGPLDQMTLHVSPAVCMDCAIYKGWEASSQLMSY